jgi:phage terminase Nu1 subunit (DNA packaging protein)
MSDTPRTDALIYRKNTIEMQRHELLDLALALERELAEAQAEITRLKGEAESWEKVFDRTCEHLADAKTALAEAVAAERERCALVCEEFYSVEGVAQKCAEAIRKGE